MISTFNRRIKELSNAYFAAPEGKPIQGITIDHPVEKAAEEDIIKFLKKKEINESVVAWKAGTLIRNQDGFEPKMKDRCYLTRYGNKIKEQELKDYLLRVKRSFMIQDDIEKMYTDLLNLTPPKFFGSVYIINLLYFLSGADWPIYDRYAHKAAKALFIGKRPDQIYTCEAPAKNRIKDVVNMYTEYIWLLEKLFAKRNIEREIDQALWVYGHAKEEFTL